MAAIRTTHTGSLPRPADLSELLYDREEGKPTPGLESRVAEAVNEIVRRQVAAGVSVVNDGEMSKIGYSTYVKERLTGFGPVTDGLQFPRVGYSEEFPDYVPATTGSRGLSYARSSACIGEVTLKDPEAVQTDIANLRTTAAANGADEVFLSAASPGVIAYFLPNEHYPTREDYLGALVEAMRSEYKAIVDAGIILQLDCPDLAMTRAAYGSLDEFLHVAAENVEALNEAVRDLPADRLRMHLCWGNSEAPHVYDVELREIIETVLRAKPAGISLEACNPRHAHEWRVFEDVRLPEDRYLIPGVVDSTNNFVEHPDLVAERLLNYARIVGTERVIGGSDCGFGTFAGVSRVAPSVVWAKLASMAEGARRATDRAKSEGIG